MFCDPLCFWSRCFDSVPGIVFNLVYRTIYLFEVFLQILVLNFRKLKFPFLSLIPGMSYHAISNFTWCSILRPSTGFEVSLVYVYAKHTKNSTWIFLHLWIVSFSYYTTRFRHNEKLQALHQRIYFYRLKTLSANHICLLLIISPSGKPSINSYIGYPCYCCIRKLGNEWDSKRNYKNNDLLDYHFLTYTLIKLYSVVQIMSNILISTGTSTISIPATNLSRIELNV